MRWRGSNSKLYTKIHTENKIALETMIPERIKDSIKANRNIAIHASSLLLLRNVSIFSNIINFLKNNFDALLTKNKNIVIFGEDSGKIGDVNQGLEGLQIKHGKTRVDDRGIREASIVGEGIGLAMRGFKPIAEIQYLDYLMFALQTLSDDLATLYYRTVGKQKAPLIIRTRGHRLEGMWHAGSPMGMILNSLKGLLVLTPRNMVQASGMYNLSLIHI